MISGGLAPKCLNIRGGGVQKNGGTDQTQNPPHKAQIGQECPDPAGKRQGAN